MTTNHYYSYAIAEIKYHTERFLYMHIYIAHIYKTKQNWLNMWHFIIPFQLT